MFRRRKPAPTPEPQQPEPKSEDQLPRRTQHHPDGHLNIEHFNKNVALMNPVGSMQALANEISRLRDRINQLEKGDQ